MSCPGPFDSAVSEVISVMGEVPEIGDMDQLLIQAPVGQSLGLPPRESHLITVSITQAVPDLSARAQQ